MYRKLIEHHMMSAYFNVGRSTSEFAWAVGHTQFANWLIDKRHAKERITYEEYSKQARLQGISCMNEEHFKLSIDDQ